MRGLSGNGGGQHLTCSGRGVKTRERNDPGSYELLGLTGKWVNESSFPSIQSCLLSGTSRVNESSFYSNHALQVVHAEKKGRFQVITYVSHIGGGSAVYEDREEGHRKGFKDTSMGRTLKPCGEKERFFSSRV